MFPYVSLKESVLFCVCMYQQTEWLQSKLIVIGVISPQAIDGL